MTTSNGTQAIIKAQSASTLYMGALLNATTGCQGGFEAEKGRGIAVRGEQTAAFPSTIA